MYDVVVQQIEHRVVRQDISAQVHHADVSGQSGCNARIARSTCYEPNVGLDESGNVFMSMADGDDEDLMETKKSQFGQAPLPISLERSYSSNSTKELGCSLRAVQRQAVYVEVPTLPQ